MLRFWLHYNSSFTICHLIRAKNCGKYTELALFCNKKRLQL
ncbi:hypothetical protein AEST_00600 [Alishewanella aestuarii B11]|uniref:Uncharacterized protein n=1 Tax=Alishewanella aestuarii B11 TaxID=1197174 RepID=J2IJM5_9ALTE|nr:hypothetical protein AEST_00600 [Alishewanella aestuarii B11]